MTFASLKKAAKKHRSAFFAEEFLPAGIRKALAALSGIMMLAFGGLILLGTFPRQESILAALFFLFVIAHIKMHLLDAFCFSHECAEHDAADFETLSIVHATAEKDIIRGFILSDIGELCLRRAGASHFLLDSYLRSPARKLASAADFDRAAASLSEPLSLSEYAKIAASLDPAFAALLAEEKMTLEELAAAAHWTSEMISGDRNHSRWWTRENLVCAFRHRDRAPAKSDAAECDVLAPLLGRAPAYEAHYGIFFTYPALLALSRHTQSCVIGTIAADKAHEKLDELALAARASDTAVVTEEEVRKLFRRS